MKVIYGLRERGIDDIRYVGQTKLPLKERLHLWKSNSRRGGDTPIFNWVRSLGDSLEIVHLETTESPDDVERRWIALLKPTLFNVATGGAGCPGVIHSEETRKRRADSVRANWEKQEVRQRFFINEEQRQRQIEGVKRSYESGMRKPRAPHSEETKRKISESNKRAKAKTPIQL